MYQKIILPVFFLIFFCFSCTTLHKASLKGDINKVRNFIEDKRDVNLKDNKGMTPLMYAAISNNEKVIEILIQNGADIHLKNNDGQTALYQAFHHEKFHAFKALLEHGAALPEVNIYENISDSDPKQHFYKLMIEYRLYKKIATHQQNTLLDLFDAYFSQFSNGYYKKQVQDIFVNIINSEYNKAKLNLQSLKDFISKYIEMGKNYYIIIADNLNIRSINSVQSQSLGTYYRGNKVYAIKIKDTWMQTDRGWINNKFTKKILKTIPIVQSYIKKANQQLDILSKKFPVKVHKKPLSSPKNINAKLPIDNIQTQQDQTDIKFTKIKKELDNLMQNPTLKALENFIKKYKADKNYSLFVETARQKYKSILLGN